MREADLQSLLDRQAIADVLQRYARTLDWLDDAAHATCYWPDAPIDYGFFTGTAADFIPVVMAIERASRRRWHLLNPPQIAFDHPDSAEVECYGMAVGVREQAGVWTGNLFGGRYLDRFARRHGEWRIAARRYVMDWSMPVGVQNDGTPDPAFPLPILAIDASGHPLYRSI